MAPARSACLPHLTLPEPPPWKHTINLVLHEALVCAFYANKLRCVKSSTTFDHSLCEQCAGDLYPTIYEHS